MTEEKIKCEWLNETNDMLLKKLYLPSEDIMKISHFNENKIHNSFSEINQTPKLIKKLEFKPIELQKQTVEELNKKLQNKIIKINENTKLTDKKKETKIKTETTKSKRLIDHINDVKIARKFDVPISNEQKRIIFDWFKVCDRVYNKCVSLYNEKPNGSFKYTKKQVFDILFPNNYPKRCPYDTLSDEYKKFNSNLKSAKSNLDNGNVKHFTMTRKKNLKGKAIFIAKKAINKNGILTTLLGSISGFDKIIDVSNIECDCQLIYEKLTDRFYLHIPQYIEKKITDKRKKVVAWDAGEKIFGTLYSLEEIGKIGEDMRKPILHIQKYIKKQQKILSIGKNKIGDKLKHKSNINKKIQKAFKRIHHLVDELHHQTAKYLCENYERLLIPKFETQKMIKNVKPVYTGTPTEIKQQIRTGSKKIRLSRRVKFVLSMLSHYRFRQHLLNKAKEYGCQVVICTEEYTTQCCGKCGYLSKNCIGRTKVCVFCDHKLNRDINGARNIFIKNFHMIGTVKAE